MDDTLTIEQLVAEMETHEFPDDAEINTDLDKYSLSSNNSPFDLSLRIKEFEDPKQFMSYIKSCERLIRSSPEYRYWTEYIREALGHTVCDVTGELHSQATVDIHHHPFTLYDVVKCLILEKLTNTEEFCTFDICTSAIQLHYQNRVPYCLLVKSMHEKYHNGFLQLPMCLVKGDHEFFFKNFLPYLEDEEDDYKRIIAKVAVNKENCGWDISWRKMSEQESA